MKKQNKLGNYLAVTVGAGCAASVAEGVVTFYGIGAANTLEDDPLGIGIGDSSGGYTDVNTTRINSAFARTSSFVYFTQGANLARSGSGILGNYLYDGSFYAGAMPGTQNYANIDFNNDGIYEAVGQFFFDGLGGGFLIAIATTNDVPNPQDLSGVGGPALSISEGRALIEAALIPEPSSLALLALGSAGLITRRQRKKAA